MSEVASRPARGRSSARGGRGGYSSRGARTALKQTNGDHRPTGSVDFAEEEGDLGELKAQYATQLATIRETFPDWSDLDLVYALHECDGDLQVTSEKILEGQISQFSDVPKKTDRSRSKVKEAPTADSNLTQSGTMRGRGRGFESSRGGRGRGTERGRGGFRGSRGGAHAAANGARPTGPATSVPTTESSAWDAPGADTKEAGSWDETPAAEPAQPATEGQYGSVLASDTTPATASEGTKSALIPEGAPKKTWASMFAKPKPPPAVPKPATTAAPPQPQQPAEPEPTNVETPEATQPAVEKEELPIPPVADEAPEAEVAAPAEPPVTTPDISVQGTSSAQLTPSKDELTEDNLEHLPDVSIPAPTDTAASTVASGSNLGVATPKISSQRPAVPRPALGGPAVGGYATSALKATGTPGRSASFQRKVMEQQEAVVMPGNHAVDRAAVQFGSMGLNGDADPDVDEEREDAETRTQPPQHSPMAQPRTALPPAPRQPSVPAESQQDSVPTPKQAPGLPPAAVQQPIAPQQHSPSAPIGSQMMNQQSSQSNQAYSQFGRYGQPSMADTTAAVQKPYDPFGVPAASQPSQFDSYPTHSQPPGMGQPAHSALGGFSSAPNDYASYYTSDQQRNAYQNYYGSAYGQQAGGNQQEMETPQQRAGSAFGPSSADSAFPTSQAQQTQSRYGDAQNSGHNTPNPTMAAAHHSAASQSHIHPSHGQSGHSASGFPYGAHPYYNSPYYNAYMNQYGGGYGGGGYGAPFGKGMYGQPHHGYGMSPQTSYEQHTSSPANVGSFGASTMHARDSALGGSIGDYGRTAASQPPAAAQHSASSGAFGSVPDVFGRGQGMFPGQSQPYGQQQSASQAGNEDALKPFGEKSASGTGPSPSSLGQPGRPGSATNNAGGQGAQSGLPPPQSHQQGFGGYPGSQYSLGGLGGHQGGQGHGGYGAYGGAGFGSYSNFRGGWGNSYGH
ncbi:hypothetical protein K490DRAFT_59150 [Saccharata proteae CBS 121410]|uniref:RNA polymerase II degradation factor 1 n=1 Tax=Saccharata proteae CBS 121410 TaxID=1314787 RepID=A0A9P4LXI8_9PEZI|nr:hypothetical protein K490DRAFT_59150 [Saccharata proteae CBS 121410]